MQLNEIGSGHSSESHHVTSCMHSHAHFDKVGKMGAAASSGAALQSRMAAESQADAQLSLAVWLDKTLNGGRKLWGSIWGNGAATGAAEPEKESGDGRGAERISAVLPQDIHNNPYFCAVEGQDGRQGNLWRRARVKLKNMAGQLTGRFPGSFLSAQARSSSHTRQERSGGELRRRSKFRRDELVIDCVLTDDSYLLDSYDKKGAYSKLSAER